MRWRSLSARCSNGSSEPGGSNHVLVVASHQRHCALIDCSRISRTSSAFTSKSAPTCSRRKACRVRPRSSRRHGSSAIASSCATRAAM